MLSHTSEKDREEGLVTSHQSQLQPHPPCERTPCCCWERRGEERGGEERRGEVGHKAKEEKNIPLCSTPPLASPLQCVSFQLYLIPHLRRPHIQYPPPPSALTTLPVSRNEEPGWWIPALGDTELPVGVGGSGGDSTEEVRERED